MGFVYGLPVNLHPGVGGEGGGAHTGAPSRPHASETAQESRRQRALQAVFTSAQDARRDDRFPGDRRLFIARRRGTRRNSSSTLRMRRGGVWQASERL